MTIGSNELSTIITRVIALLLAFFALIPQGFYMPQPEDINILDTQNCDFSDVNSVADTDWTAFPDGELTVEHNDNGSYLLMKNRTLEWSSPSLNLYPAISAYGSGLYKLTLSMCLDGNAQALSTIKNCGMIIRGRNGGADANSFLLTSDGIQYSSRLSYITRNFKSGEWFTVERCIYIADSDLDGAEHEWNICFDLLGTAVQNIGIKDVSLVRIEKTKDTTSESIPSSAVKWIANEIVLQSTVSYANPLFDAELSAIFTHTETGKTLTVPGFWDGGNTWIIRFALTDTGEWTYTTVCSDKANASLEGRSGTIQCNAYCGDLDIYKRGFIKTQDGTRYFLYNDGTPFFYLGDTHWGMPTEEFYIGGDHAGNTGAESHFKYIVDRRVEQGFTVYQSEPIGAQYSLSNGLGEEDIFGFRDLDNRFAYIASKGLVHANAELFFTSELSGNAAAYPDEYLEKLARYWVARYGAYPVLWTTAQECDDDFYYDRGDQTAFTRETNPWKKVLSYTHKYDAYKHPGSGHQEYAAVGGTGGVCASTSAFRDVSGHTWYAAQWSPSVSSQYKLKVAHDYWDNSQGKPVINYEGRYENLWTKNFGARAQGWISFLCGMYGYGYGAVDMWLYMSTYDTTTTSNDGITDITPEDKAVWWSDSLEFDTATQCGYMREFFEKHEWYSLTPRFDDNDYSSALSTSPALYAIATKGNELYVVYFYNNEAKITCSLKGLANKTAYTMQWYNPRTNEYLAEQSVTPSFGRLSLSEKPDSNDWVLIVKAV